MPTVHRIAIPTPFPVGDVNAYLLDGEPLTLVDCGPLTDDAWEALTRGVETAGRRLEDVKRVVLTHPHPDHAGLAERVRRVAGCVVYAHSVDHPRLLGRAGAWESIAELIVEACRRAGAPEEAVAATAEDLEFHRGYAEAIGAVEGLGEGEEVRFAQSTWTVLHTPGHARGALCLWEPRRLELLSGDTLLGHISSNALLEPDPGGFRRRSLLEFLVSLERIRGLSPRFVGPGHGTAIEGDVVPLLAGRFAFYERRAEVVQGLVGEGLRTPWEIAVRLFPSLPLSATFLAVSEVVGFLDLLAERGAVAFRGQEAGRGWEARCPAAKRGGLTD